jgi:hypothetical protein
LLKVPYVEFAINSSVSESTGFALFELIYGYMPAMLVEVQDKAEVPAGIQAFGVQAMQSLFDAHNTIIELHIFQIHQANKQQGPEPTIEVNSMVYLSTKNLNLPKGHATKLLPKFVGPY